MPTVAIRSIMLSVVYAECKNKPIMLIIIMLRVIMLSVANKPIIISISKLCVIMMSVIYADCRLNWVSQINLIVADYNCAACHYAERLGATFTVFH